MGAPAIADKGPAANQSGRYRRSLLRESAVRGADTGSLDEMLSLDELHSALTPINRALDRLNRIKRRYGFDIDDIIIIAACGAINFGWRAPRYAFRAAG